MNMFGSVSMNQTSRVYGMTRNRPAAGTRTEALDRVGGLGVERVGQGGDEDKSSGGAFGRQLQPQTSATLPADRDQPAPPLPQPVASSAQNFAFATQNWGKDRPQQKSALVQLQETLREVRGLVSR